VRFHSTRGDCPPAGLSEAILRGLAPDGGLYVPEWFPRFETGALEGLDDLPGIAAAVLDPFFDGDPLAPQLGEICRRALDFPVPLVDLEEGTAVLELFHGPTAAFKDVAARFLAECFGRLHAPGGSGRPLTVLVATSGDTGSAVAAAFHGRPATEVVVLFPERGVSARQRHLLTCWGENVRSFAVRGSFDDCQALAKAAFRDERLVAARELTSANSINIGRLLPQTTYYAAASLWYLRRHGRAAGFIVPSGNLGNSVGAFWARRMGFPIRELRLALNANAVIADWFETGRYEPRPAISTLANAMDVGDPSNFERLRHLHPALDELRSFAGARSVPDTTIRDEIRAGLERWGRVWCPHTATAAHLRARETSADWVMVATAHPAKFDAIVEPLIGRPLEVPPALAAQLERPSRYETIEPRLSELRERLLS